MSSKTRVKPTRKTEKAKPVIGSVMKDFIMVIKLDSRGGKAHPSRAEAMAWLKTKLESNDTYDQIDLSSLPEVFYFNGQEIEIEYFPETGRLQLLWQDFNNALGDLLETQI